MQLNIILHGSRSAYELLYFKLLHEARYLPSIGSSITAPLCLAGDLTHSRPQTDFIWINNAVIMASIDSLHLYSSVESDMCSSKPVRGPDLWQNICWQKGGTWPQTVLMLVNLWAWVMMSHLAGCLIKPDIMVWSLSKHNLVCAFVCFCFHNNKLYLETATHHRIRPNWFSLLCLCASETPWANLKYPDLCLQVKKVGVPKLSWGFFILW